MEKGRKIINEEVASRKLQVERQTKKFGEEVKENKRTFIEK